MIFQICDRNYYQCSQGSSDQTSFTPSRREGLLCEKTLANATPDGERVYVLRGTLP
ncbi:hypothetical protein [Chlorogloeopsis sp. ULAP02]|uniref:hypothetical protein n=1 Tax=Chlorogloeopsis sp. ULAP02 TaxID=3107926 RepID=UPI00398AB9EE